MAAVKQFFKISVGDQVRASGRSYRVTHVLAIDSVLAIDLETQESTRLRLETVQRLTEEEQAPIRPDLQHFSEEDWAEAQKRLATIKPFIEAQLRTREDALALAEKNGIHVATFYRWVSLFESSGQTSSLVPDKRGRKRGTRLLQPEQEKVIQAAIEDKYLSKDKGTASDVVEEVQSMCRLAKLPVPNHNTIRSRVREVPKATALRRRGRKDLARNLYEPVKGVFPGGEFPLAVVQIDHTEADVILVDEETRKPIGRPWLTLALDVYSRMVVGLYLTFEKPSYMSVGMCISCALCPKNDYLLKLGVTGEWPVWGKPSKLHADNAKEFRGSKLKRACEEYNIDLQWRPVKKPNYGGHIERLMGTMANEIRKVPGKTFSNIEARKGYNSEGEAVMTLREFEAYIVDFIVNKYHTRKHAELETSPLAKWKQGILGDETKPGIGLLPIPSDPERIRLDFLPFINRTIQPYGVRKDHIDYYDPVLDPYINAMNDETRRKRSFLFRYDPKDISVLWFLDPADNRYIPIPYRDLSRPAISEWELRKAQAMLKAEGVKEINEDNIFEATIRLRKRIEDSKAATKAARKAATRIPGKKKSPAASVERQVPLPDAPDEPVHAPASRSTTPAESASLFDEPIEPFRVVLSR